MVRPGPRRRHRPVQLAKWNKGEEVELRLKSFAGYWKGWKGEHYTNVVFRVVPTASTSAQLLRAARSRGPAAQPAAVRVAEGRPDMRPDDADSFQNLFGMLNTRPAR